MIAFRSAAQSVIRVLLPLGLLAAAATMASDSAQDGSALPPSAPPAEARKPALAQESGLEIRVLHAGPGPYAWAVPGRVAASFITDSPERLEVLAWVGVKDSGLGVSLSELGLLALTRPKSFHLRTKT